MLLNVGTLDTCVALIALEHSWTIDLTIQYNLLYLLTWVLHDNLSSKWQKLSYVQCVVLKAVVHWKSSISWQRDNEQNVTWTFKHQNVFNFKKWFFEKLNFEEAFLKLKLKRKLLQSYLVLLNKFFHGKNVSKCNKFLTK